MIKHESSAVCGLYGTSTADLAADHMLLGLKAALLPCERRLSHTVVRDDHASSAMLQGGLWHALEETRTDPLLQVSQHIDRLNGTSLRIAVLDQSLRYCTAGRVNLDVHPRSYQLCSLKWSSTSFLQRLNCPPFHIILVSCRTTTRLSQPLL